MDLKNFISTVLVEIADGVKDAQEHYQEFGGAVNPSGFICENNNLYSLASKRVGQTNDMFPLNTIEFEVGLSDGNNTENSKGIGVLLSSVGIGANNKTLTSNSAITTIKFNLTVKLPIQDLREHSLVYKNK